MSDEPLPQSEFILYQTEDGRTRIQCRFENETLWLTQVQMRMEADTVWLSLNQLSELFGRDKSSDAVVAKFATTAADGKTYEVEHFNLDMIIKEE